MMIARIVAQIVLVGFSVSLCDCLDPEPEPAEGMLVLGMRTELPDGPATLSGGLGETLRDLELLIARITRIDVVHRTDADDPATERVITVDETERGFVLIGNEPPQIAFLNVPVGFVFQVRAIVAEASITLAGAVHPVTIPSGTQTGIKIVPVDEVPFEILEDVRTAGRIIFPPFHQIIRNPGRGFLMKAVLEAEHVSLAELSPGILLDRIAVAFEEGVTRAEVDDLNDDIGATVLAFDSTTNYYVMSLPASTSVEDALAFYQGSGETEFAIPDSLVSYRVIPNDAGFQDPGPFTVVNAPDAWDVSTGDRTALLAIVDNGFDLANSDMLFNWAINQAELPFHIFDVRVPFDRITGADIAEFDTDLDGLVTFVDLNDPANADICDPGEAGLTCDENDDGVITPLDLVDGDPDVLFGFEDGRDPDDNPENDPDISGFEDDLVGWDMRNGDNLPQNPGPGGSCFAEHGVVDAGIMAAVGNNGLDAAGMNWTARLLPIQDGTGIVDFEASTRTTDYLAIRYALIRGADVVNVSLGTTFIRGETGPIARCDELWWPLAILACRMRYTLLGGDKYDPLLEELEREANLLGLTDSLLVVAVSNFDDQDNDSSDVFDWPSELDDPNILAVTALETFPLSGPFELEGAFGETTVDIATPATILTSLALGGGTRTCSGTSQAAPLVAGALGLLIASDPLLQGDPATLRERLLCNASAEPGLPVAGERVLDVNAAVRNLGLCP